MSVQRYAKKLAQALPAQKLNEVAEALDNQAHNVDEPWKAVLLDFTVDAIERHGPEGVRMASKALEELFGGRGTKISDLTDDLETASGMLAALQSAEAKRKKAARDFLRGLGQTLGTITKGFIKGLL